MHDSVSLLALFLTLSSSELPLLLHFGGLLAMHVADRSIAAQARLCSR